MNALAEQHARVLSTHAGGLTGLLLHPGVTGVAIGLRRRDNKLCFNEIVVKVFVAHKRPSVELAPGQALPASLRMWGAEVGVDVEQMGVPRIPPLHMHVGEEHLAKARLRVPRRPVVGGASLAHPLFPVGTVALGVRDRITGAHCILSCNHVLAKLDRAIPGDPALQPAPDHGGAPDRSTVGHLLRWSVLSLWNDPRFFVANRIDAAIAACPPGMARSFVDGIGPIEAIAPAATLRPGDPVRKVGSATGLTQGTIVATHGMFIANYATLGFGNTPALFAGQILTDLPCGYGDSGALVVDAEDRAAGLLFAATDASHTWCNPFEEVALGLGIALLPHTRPTGRHQVPTPHRETQSGP